MGSPSSSVWDALPSQISRPNVAGNAFWTEYEKKYPTATIHLAILAKPYIEAILDGNKTIESRFSIHRRLPYERVKIGDAILLKQTSGPIKGIAFVTQVWFYRLGQGSLEDIRRTFGPEMKIVDQSFWERCQRSSYATLIKLDHVISVTPITYSKRDRNAWAVFSSTQSSSLIPNL